MIPDLPQIPADSVIRGLGRDGLSYTVTIDSALNTEHLIPIGLYARISEDNLTEFKGIGRQVTDGSKVADLRRWFVSRIYVDNDLSAARWDVERPAFLELIRDLDRGSVISGVIGYNLDRLFRLPVDLEKMIRLYETKTGRVFDTFERDVNLATDDGRAMARVMVAFAAKEVANTKRRTKRRHAEKAEKGEPVGGYRAFGWNASPQAREAERVAVESGVAEQIAIAHQRVLFEQRRLMDPKESELLRKARQRLLAGEKKITICREWARDGVFTPRGGPWISATLTATITSARMAGIRVYKYQPVMKDGEYVMGVQEPIFTVQEWEEIRDRLAPTGEARDRSVEVPHGNRKYMLSGLLRCARCMSRMFCRMHREKGTVRRSYLCCNFTLCGKVKVTADAVDYYMSDLISEHLHQLGERPAEVVIEEAWPREAELAAAVASQAEWTSGVTSGAVSGASAFPEIRKLENVVKDLAKERRAWVRTHTPSTESLMSSTEFLSMPVGDLRRAVIERYVTAVIVHPAERPTRRFNPERLSVVWREEGSA